MRTRLYSGIAALTVAVFAAQVLWAGDARAQCSAGTPVEEGCGDTTYEGCCDTDGSLKWCEGGWICTIPCQDATPPGDTCGWLADGPFYDCGQTGAEPTGTHPIDCVACDPPCGPEQYCDGGECVECDCPDGTVCQENGSCCVPECTDNECGDDGCGGVCGECADGTVCFMDLCCIPDCDGKTCGDDGCGGTCGGCTEVQFCNETQNCEDCTCDGMECGLNECDLSCGTCAFDEFCNEMFECQDCSCEGKTCGVDECGASCGECLETQYCDGTQNCQACSCEGQTCGVDECGVSCGDCLDTQYCDPDGMCQFCTCEGKVCGGDLCGNPCGTCTGGTACGPDGQCTDMPDSCKAKDTPGCPGCACEACVCALDAYCCDTAWDGICVGECENDCEGPACGGFCFPNCEGKVCGNDGCGGTCGACPDGFMCGPDGVMCWPCSCEGKSCGEDGCGNSCGECADGGACDKGICVPPECAALEGPGCGGCPCEACVCEIDAFCCDTMWDSICAGECADDCGGDCPCVPDCEFMECGDDGCEGSCGECPVGQVCDLGGMCCDPQCEGLDCGPDGCGGECGICGDGFLCEAGLCVECIPDCEGKNCGADGCGGECGVCPDPLICVAGNCQESGCGDITYEGCCDEEVVTWCENDMLQTIDCAENPFCGWDDAGQYYNCGTDGGEGPGFPKDCAGSACDPPCVDPLVCIGGECVECTPDCAGKNCGNDGCGGSCGTCPDGYGCDGGICKPAGCGGVSFEGCCNGAELQYCENDQLVVVDCTQNEPPGDVCGWEAASSFFNCGGADTPPVEFPIDCPPPLECEPPCPEGSSCLFGLCVGDCVPDCGFMECGGDDGCGNSCGDCGADFYCSLFYLCAACTCDGRECGEGGEGCGLDCGDCAGGPRDQVCWEGTCVEDCAPDCAGRECGDGDCPGWDNVCGVCLGGATCLPDFTCEVLCVPDCMQNDGVTPKECGDDGCGGTCGDCDPNMNCDNGVCVDICVPNCAGKDCGDDGCNGTCGACAADETCNVTTWKCDPKCVPSCAGKQCGDDGCGGTCPPGCGVGAQCVTGICQAVVPPDVIDAAGDTTGGADTSTGGGGGKCNAGFGVGANALPFALLLSGLSMAFLGRRRRD